MNLNDCVINKSKPKSKYITTNKHEQKNNDAGHVFPDNFAYFSEQINPQIPENVSSNWGKACASVLVPSSSRKSRSTKITDEIHSKTIVALTEGRGQARCEVGIAVINLSSPVLIMCQISDTQNYINTLTKMNIFNPTDILFPITFEHCGGNRLITRLKEKFTSIKYIPLGRNLFKNSNGFDMISQLCLPTLDGVVMVLRQRYYALSAVAALLTYIQDNLYIYYAARSLKIDYQESEGYALIDIATADRLELVCSTKPAQANKYSTLLGILNNCQTKIGTRMLRSWILQPPSDVEYINARLNCVEELIENRFNLSNLMIFLQKFSNLDSILNLSTLVPQDSQKCTVRQLNYVLHLNSFVDLIQPLKDMLECLKQPFFVNIRKTLGDPAFDEIRKMIRENVSEDARPAKGNSATYQRLFAIKLGVHELLDVFRKIYTEKINEMKEYVQSLAEKYNLAFTLRNNHKKGYHIILTLNKEQRRNMKKSDFSQEFIEVQRSACFFTMKTPILVNISTRIDDIVEDILKLSNDIVYDIVLNLKKHMPLFYAFCEEVAQLDVYQSLALASIDNNYIRPQFADYIEIKNGQHPLLSFLLPAGPVANSIFISDDYNLHMINGPNGSGKSVFIRQMMLLQIMAQVGSYVPADSAVFKPMNKMFARIYLDDNMEYNASSFILEIQEMKYILSSMMKDSLIIIDEPCRSTDAQQGVSLAIAIVEKLSLFSSYTLVTTHFKLLSKLSLVYPHIKTWQMETVPIGEDPKTFKLDYKYRLIRGITTVGRYGVYLIRKIWPDSIVKTVDVSLDHLEKYERKILFNPMDKKIKLKYDVESELRHLKRCHVLFVPKIREIVLKYQTGLKNLNFDLNYISFSRNRQDDLNATLQVTPIMNTQDLLAQDQRFEQLFTPINYERFESQGILENNYPPPENNYPPPESNYGDSNASFNGSAYETENSEFMDMLRPIVSLEESRSGVFKFPQLPQPRNLDRSSYPTLYCSFTDDGFERGNYPSPDPRAVSQYANEISNRNSDQNYQNFDKLNEALTENDVENFPFEENEPLVQTVALRNASIQSCHVEENQPVVMAPRNTYKFYLSPIIVNIVEGPNDTTISSIDSSQSQGSPDKAGLEEMVDDVNGDINGHFPKENEEELNAENNQRERNFDESSRLESSFEEVISPMNEIARHSPLTFREAAQRTGECPIKPSDGDTRIYFNDWRSRNSDETVINSLNYDDFAYNGIFGRDQNKNFVTQLNSSSDSQASLNMSLKENLDKFRKPLKPSIFATQKTSASNFSRPERNLNRKHQCSIRNFNFCKNKGNFKSPENPHNIYISRKPSDKYKKQEPSCNKLQSRITDFFVGRKKCQEFDELVKKSKETLKSIIDEDLRSQSSDLTRIRMEPITCREDSNEVSGNRLLESAKTIEENKDVSSANAAISDEEAQYLNLSMICSPKLLEDMGISPNKSVSIADQIPEAIISKNCCSSASRARNSDNSFTESDSTGENRGESTEFVNAKNTSRSLGLTFKKVKPVKSKTQPQNRSDKTNLENPTDILKPHLSGGSKRPNSVFTNADVENDSAQKNNSKYVEETSKMTNNEISYLIPKRKIPFGNKKPMVPKLNNYHIITGEEWKNETLETSVSSASRKPNLDKRSDPDKVTINDEILNRISVTKTSFSKRRNLNAGSYPDKVPLNDKISVMETSISSASKRRNLDAGSEPDKVLLNDEISIMETSVSSASKRRNLNAGSDPDKIPLNDEISVMETSVSSSKRRNLEAGSYPVKVPLNYESFNMETTVSSASKRRNLDAESDPDKVTFNDKISVMETTVSSASKRLNLDAGSYPVKVPLNDELFIMETSVSSASKRRNLDAGSYPDKVPLNDKISVMETSISGASKRRNLDSGSDSDKVPLDDEISITETSVSSASKRRNLNAGSDPDRIPLNDEISVMETSVYSASKRRNLDAGPDPEKVPLNDEFSFMETSVSSASKRRNLDAGPDPDKVPLNDEFSFMETSVSSASKRRNLDAGGDPDKVPLNDEFSFMETSVSSASKRPNLDAGPDPDKVPLNDEISLIETSVSSASKRRNLDTGSDPDKVPLNDEISLMETTVSSASKRRNLDAISYPDKIDDEIVNEISVMETSVSSAWKERNLDAGSDPYNTVIREELSEPIASASRSTCQREERQKHPTKIVKLKTKRTFKKFVPPRKLTAKQIKEDFYEQDKKLLERSPSSSNINKFLEQRFNRPTVKQIQNSTYLGSIQKCGTGYKMVPPKPLTRRKSKLLFKSFTSEKLDMSIFCDRNSTVFEEFINSKETNFRNFHFNKSPTKEKTLFSFNQEQDNLFGYHLATSQKSTQRQSQSVLNMTLTPSGYYKENKDEINSVMNKYLNLPSTSGSSQTNGKTTKNIFGNNYLSEDDLKLD